MTVYDKRTMYDGAKQLLREDEAALSNLRGTPCCHSGKLIGLIRNPCSHSSPVSVWVCGHEPAIKGNAACALRNPVLAGR